MSNSLLSTVPLRRTSAWGDYETAQTLYHAYGTVTVKPIKYRADGRAWFCGEGPIAGVRSLVVDGVTLPASSYIFVNTADVQGRPIGLIQLSRAPKESISATIVGKLDPLDGSVITNPAIVLYDFLTRIAGFSIARSQLDRYRIECNNAALQFSGLISDASLTNRAQADDLVSSAGAVFSLGMSRIARLYPRLSAPEAFLSISLASPTTEPAASSVISADDVKTILTADYAWDHNEGRATRSMRLQSSTRKTFGDIEEKIDLKWVSDDQVAASVARRILAYISRPVVTFSCVSRARVSSGEWVNVQHPYNAANGVMFVVNSESDPHTDRTQLNLIAPYGSAPTITLVSTSRRFVSDTEQLSVQFRDGKVTITARDEDGRVLAGALITLDEKTQQADSKGQSVFTTSPGLHTLRITAQGKLSFSSDQYYIGSAVSA